MRCADLADLISAYDDGETGPARTEFIEAHLGSCARCRATQRGFQQTRQLLGLLADEDEWTVPDLRLRVAHATRTGRRDGRRWRVQGGLIAGLIAVLSVVAAAENSALPQALRVAQGNATPALSGTAPCGNCARYYPAGAGTRTLPAHPSAASRATSGQSSYAFVRHGAGLHTWRPEAM